MYNAFIYPYHSYALPVCRGSAPYCYVNPILVFQKRSIRASSKSPYFSHTNVICAKLGFVKTDVLFEYIVLQLMHKIYYNNAPLCLLDLFIKSFTIHNHLTRNVPVNFHVNYSRAKLYSNSFVNTGIHLRNELDLNDRLIISINLFQKKVLLTLH